MSSHLVTVFTDGSSLGNPGPGGWAWWRHDGCWTAGSLPHTTNQQAELIALLMALKQVPKHLPLRVASDSQYAVNMANKWLKSWKKAGWRTVSGQPVANLNIVKHIDAALRARTMDAEILWVRGHNGLKGNEAADRAAVLAAHAEKSGKVIPKGPGWSSAPPPKQTRTIADQRRTAIVSPAAARPKGTTRDKGRSPGVVRADGALGGARPEKGLSVMKCSSCGSTLHPLSLDCRCTR